MPALLMRTSRRPYSSLTVVTALEMEESEVTSSSIDSRERPEGREAIAASYFARERLPMRTWYVGFSVASFFGNLEADALIGSCDEHYGFGRGHCGGFIQRDDW